MNGAPAAAALSDSAGHRFGRASLRVCSWGTLGLGDGGPKPAQGLQWSQLPVWVLRALSLTCIQGLWPPEPGMILVRVHVQPCAHRCLVEGLLVATLYGLVG